MSMRVVSRVSGVFAKHGISDSDGSEIVDRVHNVMQSIIRETPESWRNDKRSAMLAVVSVFCEEALRQSGERKGEPASPSESDVPEEVRELLGEGVSAVDASNPEKLEAELGEHAAYVITGGIEDIKQIVRQMQDVGLGDYIGVATRCASSWTMDFCTMVESCQVPRNKVDSLMAFVEMINRKQVHISIEASSRP